MRAADYYRRMESLGFTCDEADKLRLIEKTLQRWAELECGNSNDHASWAIERDEATERPFLVTHHYPRNGSPSYTSKRAIADRERGALRRLSAIMANHAELWSYHQCDPRGCALYVGRKSDIRDGERLDSVYTRGLAACID